MQSDGNKSAENLHQLEYLVEHSLMELQRLIADLRPSHLDDLGLGAALRWYAGEIEKRLPLEVSVSVRDEKSELSSELKTTMFRITQEALTNVIKHSAANQTWVNLNYEINGVRLEVIDDGVGFDQTTMQSAARPSWGLIGMQERASLLGGTFEFNSFPGSGTRVNVYIPYGSQPEEIDDENSPVAR